MKLIATISMLTYCVIAHAGPKEDMEKDADALVQSNAQLLADFNVKLKFMQDQVFKPRVAQYEAEVAEYNARCNRQFNRETEITQFTQCNTDMARIDAERVSTQQWMNDTTAKWNAENQAPVNAQIEKNNARLKELQVAYAQSSTDSDECYKASATDAIAACTRAITSGQLSPSNLAIVYNNRGINLEKENKYDDAIADYDQALRLDPQYKLARSNRSKAWVNKCFKATVSGEQSLGIGQCTRAIESDQLENDDLSIAYVNRGGSYRGKGDFEHAVADYNSAVRTNQNNAQAYVARGKYYRFRGEESAAQADFDRAIAIPVPLDISNAYLNRARAYSAKGDLTSALTDLDAAARIDPKGRQVYVERASIYASKRNYERAIADYDEALRLNPSDAALLRSRGDANVGRGDIQRALADYDASISIQGNVADGFAGRALIHRIQGNPDLAIVDCNQAIRLDPNRGFRYTNRADAYLAKGDWKSAIDDYDRAVQAEPDRGYYRDARAGNREYRGDYTGALADRDETIRLEPRDADFRVTRAWTLLHMGRVSDALAGFSDAIEIDPHAAKHFRSRGYALLRLSRYDEALADFDRAIQLDPARGINYASRADVFLYRGQPLDGLPDIDRAHARDSDYENALKRGFARLAGDQLDNAIGDFTSYISVRPNSSAGYYGRGFARMLKGDLVHAVEDFRHTLDFSVWDSETALWLYFARARLGQDARPESAQYARRYDPKKWPGQVFLFVKGATTVDAMLKSAVDPSALITRAQEAQAYFFAGEHYLAVNRADDARTMFQEVLNRKQPDSYSTMGAASELRTLGIAAATTGKNN